MQKRVKFFIIGFLACFFLNSSVFADVKKGLEQVDAGNYQHAAELFKEAFKAGDPDGAFYLGRLVELGLGTGKQGDPASAAALFMAGSEKGSLGAKNRLGLLYLEGLGVLQDFEKGADLICSSADAGYTEAMYNCGVLYKKGQGVHKDLSKAVFYYKKAADKQFPQAQNALAEALYEGKGLDKNQEKAVQLWQKTASIGNIEGFFHLGISYAKGEGVKKDLIKAHAYLNLAASGKFPQAFEERTRLESEMSPDQVSQAQKIARLWKPRHQQQ